MLRLSAFKGSNQWRPNPMPHGVKTSLLVNLLLGKSVYAKLFYLKICRLYCGPISKREYMVGLESAGPAPAYPHC